MLPFLIHLHILQRAGQGKYVASGSLYDMNNASTVSTAVPFAIRSGAEGPEMLSSLLAAASPEQQKQILGERLYPLVNEHKVRFIFIYNFFPSGFLYRSPML